MYILKIGQDFFFLNLLEPNFHKYIFIPDGGRRSARGGWQRSAGSSGPPRGTPAGTAASGTPASGSLCLHPSQYSAILSEAYTGWGRGDVRAAAVLLVEDKIALKIVFPSWATHKSGFSVHIQELCWCCCLSCIHRRK